MLSHDFLEMPSRSTEIGFNPHETVLLLRCRWCMKTPKKAREDGCAIRVLAETGLIRLDEWNPDGVAYFKERTCVTCLQPIMEHWLRCNSADYWCTMAGDQRSEGINDCVYDVEGVTVPVERECPPQ